VFWETICCQTAHFYHFLVGRPPLRMRVAFLSLPPLCKPLAILWKGRILPLSIVLDAASPPNVTKVLLPTASTGAIVCRLAGTSPSALLLRRPCPVSLTNLARRNWQLRLLTVHNISRFSSLEKCACPNSDSRNPDSRSRPLPPSCSD